MRTYITVIGLLVFTAACSPGPSGVNHNPEEAVGIRNGQLLTQLHQYPAQRSVVMLQATNENTPSASCTAVLISKNIGLTSAHCLEKELKHASFRVVFGLRTFATAENHRPGLRYVLHPKYQTDVINTSFNFTGIPGDEQKTSLTRRYDLAVFSFRGELPAGFRPAKYDTDRSKDRSNESVISYGAGQTYHPDQIPKGEWMTFGKLRRGELQIGSNFNQFEDFYFTSVNTQNQLCNGDSGGPQFLANAKVPTIVGIHSARLNNEKITAHKHSFCGHVSLVTKVAPFADWIAATQAELEKSL